jgi:hypothetical protein
MLDKAARISNIVQGVAASVFLYSYFVPASSQQTADPTIVRTMSHPAWLSAASLAALTIAVVVSSVLNLVALRRHKEIEKQIPSILVNGVPVAGPAKVATAQVFGVAINYPVPQLRQEVVSMCSELQGFAGEHGKQPTPERHPQESDGDFLQRWRTIVEPWRARFVGDYRLKFGDSVSRMRDTIRAKTGIDDGALNASIERADNPNVSADAVQDIIKRLWDIAREINT